MALRKNKHELPSTGPCNKSRHKCDTAIVAMAKGKGDVINMVLERSDMFDPFPAKAP